MSGASHDWPPSAGHDPRSQGRSRADPNRSRRTAAHHLPSVAAVGGGRQAHAPCILGLVQAQDRCTSIRLTQPTGQRCVLDAQRYELVSGEFAGSGRPLQPIHLGLANATDQLCTVADQIAAQV